MKINKIVGIIILTLIFFTIFTLTTSRIDYHDTPEYISGAKEIAGYSTGKIYATHSFLYSSFLAAFLNIIPAILTLKLINAIFVILTALIIYLYTKDKKAFLLMLASPIAWITSYQITPIMAVMLFFTITYLSIKKQENKYLYLSIAGLSAGICLALYFPSIFILTIFTLIFFYDKKMLDLFLFLATIIIGTLPRFLLDYFLTGFPFYSSIRYIGTNLMVLLGINSGTSPFQGLINNPEYLFLIILISPLLFYIYKLKFKEYPKEIIFLIITILFFIIRGGLLKYFLPFIPIIIILLSKTINTKKVIFAVTLSIVISFLFAVTYHHAFTNENNEFILNQDIKQINQDFNITQAEAIGKFPIYLWQNKIEFIWQQEKEMINNNKTFFTQFIIEPEPKINLYKQLYLEASLKRDTDYTIQENPPTIAEKGENLEIEKCYQILCVYKPKSS